ncbi:nuclease [bacterium]|nr:nuclease [bacterium]
MAPQNHSIVVVADDRERGSGVLDIMRDADNIDLEVRRLYVGDYRINGRLLFERKTFHDFCVSIIDGRLFRQARCLAAVAGQSAIILEGTSSDLESTGVSREAMQGALISLSLTFGIPVLRSMNPEESVRLMIYAAGQLQQSIGHSVTRRGYRPRRKRRRQLYILQGFPGIGRNKAEQLIDHFGSIKAIVNADVRKLTEVPGIGPRIAEIILGLIE